MSERSGMSEQEALSKLQAEELDILLAIARLCEIHEITWFLEGGTALGAARHQGFIPWDDDVDIAMLRDDYEKFLRVAARELPKGYSLHTSRDTFGFAPMFAKVYKDGTSFETAETRDAGCQQGIFVDVFPYDRLALDSSARKRQVRKSYNAQRLAYLCSSGAVSVLGDSAVDRVARLGCRVVHVLLKGFGRDAVSFQDSFDRAAIMPAEQTSDEVLSLVWANMDPLDVGCLIPTGRAVFEGHELPVPQKLEQYLENMYGDWRQLPSPENRHTHLPLRLQFSDGTRWER